MFATLVAPLFALTPFADSGPPNFEWVLYVLAVPLGLLAACELLGMRYIPHSCVGIVEKLWSARGSVAEDELLVSKESNSFPLPLTQELLERGENRYKIFCTPCHGLQGDGNGMVAMRGMKHPPSYHEDRLRQVPNGYLYDVIGNGFGAMLGYSAQIAPRDRWAIVAYVRALQLSRNAGLADLPADVREKVLHPPAGKNKEGTPETPGGKKE